MEQKIKSYILSQPKATRLEAPAQHNAVFAKLRELGTELWLDTGDIAAASKAWDASLTCLTTNNTLLNQVIQTGIYDALVKDCASLFPADMSLQDKVSEIAFILNAAHGLKLAQTFGDRVSVELHTDWAHNWRKSVEIGKRFAEIGGHSFIVKIPMTPDGLIAARKLQADGIDINFTLGFSARQNYVAASFSKPAFVNVFLGRLNQYMSSNKLGSGDFVGDKATLASQHFLRQVNTGTRQIAASMRTGDQCKTLAGVDVFTMPIAVAQGAVMPEADQTRSVTYDQLLAHPVGISAGGKDLHANKLWEVDAACVAFVKALSAEAPEDPFRIVDLAHEHGVGDIFPRFTEADLNTLSADGKIPVHAKWEDRVASGDLAVDSLLQVAALLSFTTDQKQLDDRIRSFL